MKICMCDIWKEEVMIKRIYLELDEFSFLIYKFEMS